jgi:hypothetical protein
MKFTSLEPFLSERVDIAGGIVAVTIANVNRGKGSKAFSLEDFLVVKRSMQDADKKELTKDELEALHLKTFILSMGGRLQ